MSGLFAELPHAVTIDRQIQCVERELAQRRHVYPRLVAKGSMTQDQSDREIACMEAVAATLHQTKAAKENGK